MTAAKPKIEAYVLPVVREITPAEYEEQRRRATASLAADMAKKPRLEARVPSRILQ